MISIEEYKLLKRIENMHRLGYEQRVTECYNEVIKCVSDFNNNSINKLIRIYRRQQKQLCYAITTYLTINSNPPEHQP